MRASEAWSLGTGTSINPLDDNLILLLGPLRSYLLHDPTTLQVQQISDLLDNNGQWDIVKLSGSTAFTYFPLALPQRKINDQCRAMSPVVMPASALSLLSSCPQNLNACFLRLQLRERNALVFNGILSIDADTVQCSITWARYYSKCIIKAPSSHSPSRESKHWQRPELGWVSLCTDGVISPATGIGSVSGVFRTDDGSWIYGFNKSIGIMQPLQAELWGIFVGLQIAWDIGFERLLIQSDSKEAIKLLNDNDVASNHCALVCSIARLRNLRWETTTQWIPRTGNEPVDMLAKFDNLPYYNTTYFDQPPKLLLPLLDLDTLNSM
ncbi:hypothetical protein V6N12_003073 [Hibiscus sabdariffa]|uniref:RNase H type-1 domain-containing protein n=1 Tax=Hibiscus sabdariffa TaxID=183260 RepID=A0ABR2ECK0_9ROSI